jgi:succinate dehydrogenase / fumarate reductase cytochrome b subunit
MHMAAQKTKFRIGGGVLGPLSGLGGALDPVNKPNLVTVRPKKMYRWHLGFVAWLLHRLTGIVLAGYLILHLYVLSNLAKGPESFDAVMTAFSGNVLFRLLEICLMAVMVYHTINGLRVVLLDYGRLAEKDTFVKWIYITFAAIAGVVLIGAIIMLVHIFSH